MENTYRPRLVGGKRVASPEYRSWQMMKNRCTNPRARDYKFYGGRGITVCQRWMGFDEFIADMGPRPTPLHTLERRNTERGYSKRNCYWATRQEQSRNRRFIKRYKGKTTWEWAEELGIQPATFHHRLWRFNSGQISEGQLFARPTDKWKLKC